MSCIAFRRPGVSTIKNPKKPQHLVTLGHSLVAHVMENNDEALAIIDVLVAMEESAECTWQEGKYGGGIVPLLDGLREDFGTLERFANAPESKIPGDKFEATMKSFVAEMEIVLAQTQALVHRAEDRILDVLRLVGPLAPPTKKKDAGVAKMEAKIEKALMEIQKSTRCDSQTRQSQFWPQ